MVTNTTSGPTGILYEDDEIVSYETINSKITDSENSDVKMQLIWFNIGALLILHIGALYGFYLTFTAKIATLLFAFFLFYTTAVATTAGPHRLWAHRSYKAKWPLRLLLIIFQSATHQGHVFFWTREHRVHHKYSDTSADPHNAKRGFFFSHIGWLLVRKHPDVAKKGKGVDMSDLYADPILRFQKKYYFILLLPLFGYVLPTVIPVYFWNETWKHAFLIPGILRLVLMLHNTFLVNSAAHLYGNQPYDKNILPKQNLFVSITAVGEGWHNYHHTFPWDYKASELGNYSLNTTTAFIDFMAWIGWAYDLKTVSQDIVKKRVERTGDGSHELWGWGDKDLTKEDHDATIIYNSKQM